MRCATALFTLSTAALLGATEIHVAPGKPTGNGTAKAPYGTLAQAQMGAREALARGERVTVILHGGTYFPEAGLAFTAADSGTAEQPVVWRAAEGETPVLSGGTPITGWRRGENGLWTAGVPDARDLAFDQLFVDGARAIRARHPNLNTEQPSLGEFLFARMPAGWDGSYGSYLYMMLPGYWTEYDVDIPEDGDYAVWFRYGALNKPWGAEDMAGRCSLLVDGEHRVELANLPDTGGWERFTWPAEPNAMLSLTQGPHTLRWTDDEGPGLNIDAIVLSTNPDWKPDGVPPPPPETGALVEIQAESFVRKHGEKVAFRMEAAVDRLFFDEGALDAWPQSPDKELAIWIYEGCGTCSNMMQPIKEIDPEHRMLVIEPQQERYGSHRLLVGARFFVENVREALDVPNEWYLDRDAGQLELMREPGADAPEEAVGSRLETLVTISADHIRFEGLTFAHTAYRRQKDHWYHSESNAVRLLNANHCRFLNCTFRNLGGGAIVVNGASEGNDILGCEVTETGAGGFTLNSNPDNLYAFDPDRYTRPPTTRANRILGNHIHHIGRIWKHGAGIYLHATADNEIRYNDIHHTARHPIIATGRCGGNDISFNRLLFSNLETGDCGAIHTYTTWHAKEGNRICNNIIGDVIGMGTTQDGNILRPHYTWGIYLDNDTDKTLVRDNIVYRTVRGSVYIHGGSDNVIVNNILVDAQMQQFTHGPSRGHDGKNNRFERNVVAYSSSEGSLGLGPKDNPEIVVSDHNLFWAHGRNIPDLDRLRKLGMDTHSVVADPLFRDPQNDDYRLAPDSPALKLGFQPIDTSRVGRVGWQGPTD
jgi:parallel beta-helix repeat protein